MDAAPAVARVASLLGDPARAAMLLHLLDGRPRPAGELALRANVSPQAASGHLSRLREADLIAVEPNGRHRYYRLVRRDVAEAVEALLSLGAVDLPLAFEFRDDEQALRRARTCYDHLAGRLAIALTDRLLSLDIVSLADREFSVTGRGAIWFGDLGVDVAALATRRRSFARACLDWSERQPHIAGALGAALLDQLVQLGWLERKRGTRALRITDTGRQQLAERIGVTMAGDAC
jgi:DNA-binding transcriptional ArsR family regulator